VLEVGAAVILLPLLFLATVFAVIFLAFMGAFSQFFPLFAVVIVACFALVLITVLCLVTMGRRE